MKCICDSDTFVNNEHFFPFKFLIDLILRALNEGSVVIIIIYIYINEYI
jgi:hypothetical protein